MSQDVLLRIKVRALASLRSGWISVEPLLLVPTPGIVRLGPHVPSEMPLEMLPPDLRVVGSIFWMVISQREPVGYERVDSAAAIEAS